MREVPINTSIHGVHVMPPIAKYIGGDFGKQVEVVQAASAPGHRVAQVEDTKRGNARLFRSPKPVCVDGDLRVIDPRNLLVW